MKVLSRSFLIILFVSTGIAQALPSFSSLSDLSRYDVANGYFRFSRVLAAFTGSAMSVGYWINFNKRIQASPDAPEAVVTFCQEKLKKHGLNACHIQIKVTGDSQIVAACGNYIVFGPVAANEFRMALENPSDERSANVIKIYSTFLDHEIAHLKYNDALKRQGFLFGVSALSYGAATGLMSLPRVNSLFEKPQNVRQFFKVLLAYAVVNGATGHMIKSLYGWYARHQENEADAYAIAHAKDPQALRYSAQCLEMLDNGIVDFLCGADLHPSIPLMRRAQLIAMRNMLVSQYQMLKPQEDFRTWVKQQTKFLSQIKSIFDPEHPSGFDRAEIMRAAADALEAEQKGTADTSLPVAAQAA
jgi:hypothetical protein